MKRLLIMLCAVMMTALLLCSCTQAAEDAKNAAATMAQDAMDAADQAAENGKTDEDKDGFIEKEDHDETQSRTEVTENITQPYTEGDLLPDEYDENGMIINGTEVTENNDFV